MKFIFFVFVLFLFFPALARDDIFCKKALDSNIEVASEEFLRPEFSAVFRNEELQNTNTIVERLNKKRVSILLGSGNADETLRWASYNGRLGLVDLVIKHHTPININSVSNGFNPLLLASFAGQTDVVEILVLVFGIDINITDDDGMSSIMWASFKGYVDIVDILLKHNAELDLTIGSLTALDLAKLAGNIEITNKIETHLNIKTFR